MQRLIGIENEFNFSTEEGIANREQAKKILTELISYAEHPCFKLYDTSYRLWTGGSLYLDGKEPEIATPPIPLQPGVATTIVDCLLENRNTLLKLLETYNESNAPVTLHAYSAHYNISRKREKITPRKKESIRKSIGLPLLLLIEQANSPGVKIKGKKRRLEVGGDYIVRREQIIAAMEYMIGMTKFVDEKRWNELTFEQSKRWPDLIIGKDLNPFSRETEIEMIREGKKQVMTLQQILEESYHLLQSDIAARTTTEEQGLLEEFITGKRTFECEEQSPEYHNVQPVPIPSFTKPALTKHFGDAVHSVNLHGTTIETIDMSWDTIVFRQHGINGTIKVGRDQLVDFYKRIAALQQNKALATEENRENIIRKALEQTTSV